jgi:hypothetical protein
MRLKITHPPAAFALIADSNFSIVSLTVYLLGFVIKPLSANAKVGDIAMMIAAKALHPKLISSVPLPLNRQTDAPE